MHNKFDVKSMKKLDNLEHRKMLPPDEVLHKFGVSQGDTVADVGCGNGYFTFPANSIVGLNGKVLAMDISDEMLVQVREKANLCENANIETIKILENDFLLSDNSINVGIAFFVLHEAQEPYRFLFELNRIIKLGGKIAIIEWEKRETPHGPPLVHRIDKEEVTLLLTQAGFDVKTVDVGEDFYGLWGIKFTHIAP